MKNCSHCEKLLTDGEFYNNSSSKDGLSRFCKNCDNHAMKSYRRRNPEKTAASQRKWRRENPEQARRAVEKWLSANPDKKKIHDSVKNAVLRGRIVKCPCEKCGKLQVDAHHEDYSKPLSVRWLCRLHHKEVH